jgi:hypothetical protein
VTHKVQQQHPTNAKKKAAGIKCQRMETMQETPQEFEYGMHDEADKAEELQNKTLFVNTYFQSTKRPQGSCKDRRASLRREIESTN